MATTKSKTGTDYLRKQSGATSQPKQVLPDDPYNSIQTEKWLQTFEGLEYEPLTKIKRTDIDIRASRDNQARPEAVIQEVAERYALAMKNGAVFPPVVAKREKGKLVLIDGNHREAASKIAQGTDATLMAFIVADDTDSSILYAMMVEANALHGEAADDDWRLQQAVRLQSMGYDPIQACALAGVKEGSLRRYKSQVTAERRAERLHVPGFKGIKSSMTKVELGRIKLDTVFAAATQCVRETAMTHMEAQRFVRDINRLSNEDAMIALIAETAKTRKARLREEKAKGSGKSPLSSPRTQFATKIGGLLAIDATELRAAALTDIDRVTIYRRAEAGLEKLMAIMALFEEDGVEGG